MVSIVFMTKILSFNYLYVDSFMYSAEKCEYKYLSQSNVIGNKCIELCRKLRSCFTELEDGSLFQASDHRKFVVTSWPICAFENSFTPSLKWYPMQGHDLQ